MYPFIKEAKLMDLSASGSDNKLVFSTPNEKATVYLDASGMISKVEHIDLKKNNESILTSKDIHQIVVGESNWTRDVYHFLKPNNEEHLQMRLGITIHRGEGTWSSLPHSFEKTPEVGFEEIFFYILKGGNGRGLQVGRGLWADGQEVDNVWRIENNTFGVVPMGHHPVVGEPLVSVSYVWAYLVKKKSWEKI